MMVLSTFMKQKRHVCQSAMSIFKTRVISKVTDLFIVFVNASIIVNYDLKIRH